MKIYQAINAIMRDLDPIGKEKRNSTQGFNFRGIDDVMNHLSPLMAKHGVFVVPDIIDTDREERQTKQGGTLIYSILEIKYTFYADDGSNVSAVVIGEGMDSGDKASNKALSAGLKYALLQVFCIPTEELLDPDHSSPEVIGKKDQQPKPEAPKKKKYSEMNEKEKLDKLATVMTERLAMIPGEDHIGWRNTYGLKDEIEWKEDVCAMLGEKAEFMKIIKKVPEQFKQNWINKENEAATTEEKKQLNKELSDYLEAFGK